MKSKALFLIIVIMGILLSGCLDDQASPKIGLKYPIIDFKSDSDLKNIHIKYVDNNSINRITVYLMDNKVEGFSTGKIVIDNESYLKIVSISDKKPLGDFFRTRTIYSEIHMTISDLKIFENQDD